MASITFEHVSKNYPGAVAALREVDLTVGDGEMMVVLGASGSGKSTALRVASGLEACSGGRVLVGRRDATRLPPYRRNVSLVFQEPVLWPHMPVRANLKFGNQRRADDVVDRIAAMLEIDGLLGRLPHQLSGGERSRVSLGRALVKQPAALLLDEPFSSLDLPLRAELRRHLATIHHELGTTTILVSHDWTDAAELATSAAALDAGELVQRGTPEELACHPANIKTAQLCGQYPANWIRGEVSADANQIWFRGGGFAVPLTKNRVPHDQLTTEAMRIDDTPRPAVLGSRSTECRPYRGDLSTTRSGINQDGANVVAVTSVRNTGTAQPFIVGIRIGHYATTLRATIAQPKDAKVSIGDNLQVVFGPELTFIFDEESGKNMNLRVETYEENRV